MAPPGRFAGLGCGARSAGMWLVVKPLAIKDLKATGHGHRPCCTWDLKEGALGMTRRQAAWLGMGSVALVAWAALALLAAAWGGWAWARAANTACLLGASALAVASTLAAARQAASVERIFWALLSSGAAVAGLAQGPTGAYLPTALIVAALLTRPHRSQTVRVPLAALDGLLVASCAAFLIAYGLLMPQPRAARVLHLAADALPLVQAVVLGWTVRDSSYRRVYRLLAAGFALRLALVGLMAAWPPLDGSWIAQPASWAPVLVVLAVAGLEPAETLWIASTDGEPAEAPVGRLAVLLIALPPIVDGGVRALAPLAAGASVRSQLAMAATVLLALLAAARMRLSAADTRVEAAAPPVPGDEESGRFLSFAAGVAHQVNNRLNIVSGWSQVAVRKREGDPAALQELMAAVREASEAAGQFQRLAAMRCETEES